MINRRVIKSSLILFFITVLLFFIVQFFFRTKEYFYFSDYQYLLATSVSNAFIITSIYAIMGAYNMLTQVKNKNATFFKIFKLTFSPGVIAGLLSIITFFVIFKYVEPSWIEQLKTEYLDYSLLQAKEAGTYNDVAKIINTKAVRDTDLINIRTFTLFSLVILFFNFSLGLMLTLLWKVKTTSSKK